MKIHLRHDLLALFLIGLTVVVFFFPLLQGQTFTTVTGHHAGVYPWRAVSPHSRDFPQSDQADLTYPWRTFVSKGLDSGFLPFWNPLSFAGQPFFANGSSGVLYPPNLFAAVLLTPDWAHDVVSLLHVFASGLFMFLLLREFGARNEGALLSGVAWMLSSFNMAWLHLEVVAPVAAWLPLTLLLVSRAMRRDSWVATVGAAGGLSCVIVSGHLLFCGLVYGVASAYAVCLAVGRVLDVHILTDRIALARTVRRMLGRTGAIVLGSLCLAAVVLIPTVIFLHGLGRHSLPYDIVHHSIRVPYLVFRHLINPPPLPVSEGTMHQMVFVGILPAVFALVGFFQRRPGAALARVLTVVVFLVATDTLLLKALYLVVPQFSFFSPLGRLLNLFTFGVVLLAGIGFDAVTTRIRPRVLRTFVAASVVLFTAWQLLTYAQAINPPFVRRETQLLYPETPLIAALQQQGAVNGTAPGRIFPIRQSQRQGWTPPVLFATEAMLFGIDSAGGYDSTLPSRAETVWRIAGGEDPDEVLALQYRRAYSTSFEVDRVRFYLLARLGITMIVAPPELSGDALWTPERHSPLKLVHVYQGVDGHIFRIAGASGGPWVVHEPIVVDNARQSLDGLLDPGFDPERRVVFERSDLNGISPVQVAHHQAQTSATAVVREDGINSLRVTVTSSHPGWLVIPNTWEGGWHARVNARETPVLRANYFFQAIPVPNGVSEVDLRYRAPGLIVGTVISLLTAAGAVVVLGVLIARFRRRTLVGPPLRPRVYNGSGLS